MPPARFQIARGSKATSRFGLAVVALVLGLPLAFALFWLPHGEVMFIASSDGLRIKGDPYGRTIPLKELKLAEARPLNIAVEPAYTPTRRTNGIGLPDYRSGWFDTQGAGKALLFISDWTRGVVIPTTAGYALILGPDDPAMFIEDLKKASAVPAEHGLAPADPDASATAVAALFWATLIGVPALIALLVGLLCASTRRVVFEVTDVALRVRGDLFGRTIPRESLRLDEARVVDLAAGPDKMTLLRTVGVGLPGYLSGWCRAFRREGRFLAFLSDRSRVVSIPTADGYTLLLTPAAPDLFLQALRAPTPAGS